MHAYPLSTFGFQVNERFTVRLIVSNTMTERTAFDVLHFLYHIRYIVFECASASMGGEVRPIDMQRTFLNPAILEALTAVHPRGLNL